MMPTYQLSQAQHVRRSMTAFLGVMALLAALVVLPQNAAQAATAVPLATAEGFAILGGSTITNTGQTTVTGAIGLHPGTAVTGFGPGADAVTLNGALHLTDALALQAKTDLTTAYNNAAAQSPATQIPTELGGSILTPGVYTSAAGTFGITGQLTLDAQGDPDAVFIFQMGSTLTTAAASSITLVNDADACNVFWQAGTSATLGANSTFKGTIMADQSITLGNGAAVEGRVLARTAAVTMDSNTITNAVCTAAVDDEIIDQPVVDETPEQITEVPQGPVAAGDGTSAKTSNAGAVLAGTLLLALTVTALGLIARRRGFRG